MIDVPEEMSLVYPTAKLIRLDRFGCLRIEKNGLISDCLTDGLIPYLIELRELEFGRHHPGYAPR
jgi:hypothetical protein